MSWKRRRTRWRWGCCAIPAARISARAASSTPPSKRFPIHHILSSTTPETLAQVPVAKRDGKQLVLGDVAELAWGPQGMVGDAVINDGPGLMLIVEKYPWGNTLEVTRAVEAALERDEAWPARRGDRYQDLSPGGIHRRVHRQPVPRTDSGLHSRRRRGFRLPLRMAYGADLHRGHAAVAAGGRARALLERLDTQHDGAGGLRDRAWRRGRRRDPRRREHHAAPPRAPRRGRYAIHRPHHPRSVARSAESDLLRDADRRDCRRPGVLHAGAVGRVLQAAHFRLCDGDPRVAGCRGDDHAGAVPVPAAQRLACRQGIAAVRMAGAHLRSGARPDDRTRRLRPTSPSRSSRWLASRPGRSWGIRCCRRSRSGIS